MSKRVSPTAIGVFVVGGAALIIAAIAILGSGRLFRHEQRYICFFDGNLNNLNVGAPVKVRGVAIGSVVEILLALPPSEGLLRNRASNTLPVVIEIDETQLKRHGAPTLALQSGEVFDALIKRGLRAQLSMQSLLTGLLYVDLDFHPNTPIKLALEPGTGLYPEIPTTPTNLEQVQQGVMSTLTKLEKIDFEALASSITEAAQSAHDVLGSPDLKDAIASLRDTAANLDKTAVAVRENFDALKAKTEPLITSMKKASDDADLALAQTRSTMAQLQTTFAPDSPLAYRLNVAFDNLAQASSAMRELAEYLQRNPSSVVRGRYVSADHR
jgi:phospholipid/cholesterol/gamma-HCH transport system substrate-binding protein